MEIPLSVESKRVLAYAAEEAEKMLHKYIGTEHILLGLVKEGSGVAANVLKNLDVDLRKIRIEVESAQKRQARMGGKSGDCSSLTTKHVLHDAENRHFHFLEHLQALARIEQGNVLRRGDDHRTGYRHLLGKGKLDITGARWHVDDQIVEILPTGLVQQLVQRGGDHRSTPNHGGLFVDFHFTIADDAEIGDLDRVVIGE